MATYIEQFFGAWPATIELASTAILLAGVIILLVLGTKSIRKAGSLRNMESKRHILDEINKWAMDVGVSIHRYGDLVNEGKVRTPEEARAYLVDRCEEMQSDFMELALRSEYIKELAKTQVLLRRPVHDSIEKLRRILMLLHNYMENIEKIEQKDGVEKAIANVTSNEKSLYDCISELTRKVGRTEAIL